DSQPMISERNMRIHGYVVDFSPEQQRETNARELQNQCENEPVVPSPAHSSQSVPGIYRRLSSEGRKAIPLGFGLSLWLTLIVVFGPAALAQEMEARTYSPSPVGANFALLVYAYQSGDIGFDSALPFSDVKAKINSVTAGYGRTFNLAGRQATASIALPYVWGSVSGKVFEEQQRVTRSGLGD